MKYVCEQDCQVRIGGKVHTIARDDVIDFPKKPKKYFRKLGEGFHFDTANEEELYETDFDLDELKAYIKDRYGMNPRNRNRDNTIKMLLDCRFREIDADRIKSDADIAKAKADAEIKLEE